VNIAAAIPNQSSKNYDNVLFKHSTNLCKLYEGVIGNFITKVVLQHFSNSADFELKCPFIKYCDLFIERIEFIKNPLLVETYNLTWNNTGGDVYFNVSADVIQEIEKVTIFITIAIPKPASKNYTNVLFKHSTNLCKLSEGVIGNYVIKALLENFNNSANFVMKCPFKKVFYFDFKVIQLLTKIHSIFQHVFIMTNYKIGNVDFLWISDK
ncbi:unnamed protein product, partial [Diamesa serratosioi]